MDFPFLDLQIDSTQDLGPGFRDFRVQIDYLEQWLRH
jgi:hypothetical protein